MGELRTQPSAPVVTAVYPGYTNARVVWQAPADGGQRIVSYKVCVVPVMTTSFVPEDAEPPTGHGAPQVRKLCTKVCPASLLPSWSDATATAVPNRCIRQPRVHGPATSWLNVLTDFTHLGSVPIGNTYVSERARERYKCDKLADNERGRYI